MVGTGKRAPILCKLRPVLQRERKRSVLRCQPAQRSQAAKMRTGAAICPCVESKQTRPDQTLLETLPKSPPAHQPFRKHLSVLEGSYLPPSWEEASVCVCICASFSSSFVLSCPVLSSKWAVPADTEEFRPSWPFDMGNETEYFQDSWSNKKDYDQVFLQPCIDN